MMAYYFSKSFLSFYNTAITAVANMPGDVVPISVQTYESMQLAIKAGLVIKADANGMPVAVEPQKSNVVLTPAQQIAQYANALTNVINAVALSWQYDSVYTAATYLNSTIPQFAAEARAIVTFRDVAWNNAQVLLARVQAGTPPMPASSQAFLAIVLPSTPERPTV
jgi:hypothetical protein